MVKLLNVMLLSLFTSCADNKATSVAGIVSQRRIKKE